MASHSEPPANDEDEPDFPVLTLADISALMASAASARSRIEELVLTAKMEHSRIDIWLEHATESDRQRVAYVEGQCEEFMRRRRQENPKAKSVTTPWGTISSRVQQPEYSIQFAELLPWATGHGYMRTPKPAEGGLDWERLKKALTIEADGTVSADGVTVPGVTLTPREPSVHVSIDAR